MREMRGIPRLELAHRIDRDTSGCLLICKRRSVLVAVQEAFRQRSVKKKYDVFVNGEWPKSARTVSLRLQRYETPWGERRVRVSSSGQIARTDFSVIGRKDCLRTLRQHCIRAAHIRSECIRNLSSIRYWATASTVRKAAWSHHDYVCMRHDWWSHLGQTGWMLRRRCLWICRILGCAGLALRLS